MARLKISTRGSWQLFRELPGLHFRHKNYLIWNFLDQDMDPETYYQFWLLSDSFTCKHSSLKFMNQTNLKLHKNFQISCLIYCLQTNIKQSIKLMTIQQIWNLHHIAHKPSKSNPHMYNFWNSTWLAKLMHGEWRK